MKKERIAIAVALAAGIFAGYLMAKRKYDKVEVISFEPIVKYGSEDETKKDDIQEEKNNETVEPSRDVMRIEIPEVTRNLELGTDECIYLNESYDVDYYTLYLDGYMVDDLSDEFVDVEGTITKKYAEMLMKDPVANDWGLYVIDHDKEIIYSVVYEPKKFSELYSVASDVDEE